MLHKAFTFNLTEPIKAGKVTIGYFDGIHPSIVAVTRSDKIFVHNPHNRSVINQDLVSHQQSNQSGSDSQSNNSDSNSNSKSNPNDNNSAKQSQPQPQQQSILGKFTTANIGNDLNFLNINQTITCLAAGPISSQSTDNQLNNRIGSSKGGRSAVGGGVHRMSSTKNSGKGVRKNSQLNNDLLVVGTNTSIHVYDILHNSDLYYKEIADGANTVAIGEFGQVNDKGKIALIGGNCSIHGFDRDGNDCYWTVTGDNITAMTLVDIDDDGQNELVVGSEDCEIQVFKKDAIVVELSESDRITCLCGLGSQLFAYALANGTVGVYQTNGERLWRIKSKNQAITLFGADVNNDGQLELLTGWSNGKVDIRLVHTGEVLYREHFKSSVAGIMIADYNMDGQNEIVICTVTGEVYGYQLETQAEHHQIMNSNFEQEAIRELMKKRQSLMQELHNYEENLKIQNLADPLVVNRGKVVNEKGESYGAIPANTKLKSSLLLRPPNKNQNDSTGFIELKLETTNDTDIRAVVVFAEGIFKNESVVVYPSEESITNSIQIVLRPPKDVPVDLHIKALIGYRASCHYHVFELSRHLPRFSMYALVRYSRLDSNGDNGVPLSNIKLSMRSDDLADSNDEWFDEEFMSLINGTDYISDLVGSFTVKQSTSYGIICLPDPIERIIEWINASFLLNHEIEPNDEERRFEFVSLRNHSTLIIEIYRTSNFAQRKSLSNVTNSNENNNNNDVQLNDDDSENFGNSVELGDSTSEGVKFMPSMQDDSKLSTNTVLFYSDSMDIVGACIQSLAGDYFSLTNLPCHRAHFPDEMSRLKQLTERVEEIQSVRQHLIVEVADSASAIRSSVVLAENARLIEEYQTMKQIYNDLAILNRDMLREHTIRLQNHQDLVDSLKQINVIIQRASNLRIGSFKTSLINASREAIKQKNFAQLFKIISED